MNLHRLPVNLRGRDFVVGDLHGERAWLERELAALGFDRRHDRLFAVGDLIDRGTDSLGTLQLLDEPWFHAVLGNHEAMMLAAESSDDARFDWLRHGGEWACLLSVKLRRRWTDRLALLPHVLVVGEGTDRFQVVHAELTDNLGGPLLDADLDSGIRSRQLRAERLLWSVGLARRFSRTLAGTLAETPVRRGLSPTFCGHVPVAQPGWYQSHYFLDGGAGYDRPLADGTPPALHVRAVAPLLQAWLLAATVEGGSGREVLPPLQQAACTGDPDASPQGPEPAR